MGRPRLRVRTGAAVSASMAGVHNYGLTGEEQRRIADAVRERQAAASVASPAQVTAAVVWGWDFLALGEGYWDPRWPDALRAALSCIRSPCGTTHCAAT